MKAMIMEEIGDHLVYRDVPDPVIEEDDDVIIKVLACGVCTTDLKVLHGVLDSEGLPRILGHEPAGVVTAVGNRVTNVKVGDRVVSSTYQACKECGFCRSGRDTLCDHVRGRLGITVDGGFAEMMRIKASCIVRIPDSVDEAEACVLPCGAGVPYHALTRRVRLKAVDKVIVMGVGGIGIQAIQWCSICGASTIAVDIDETKLALAREKGATVTLNSRDPDFEEKLLAQGVATVIFDTVGLPELMNQCLKGLRKGGRIVMIGYGPGRELHIDAADVVLNEYEIYGSRGVGIKDVEDLMELLEHGKLHPIVTRYPLAQLNEIIDLIENNRLIGHAVVVP